MQPGNTGAGAMPGSHRTRNVVSTVVVVVVALVLVIGYVSGWFALLYPQGSKQTWQQWGMSMQVPAGVTPEYSGLGQDPYPAVATNLYGIARWSWDDGNVSVVVGWGHVMAGNWSRAVPVGLRVPCSTVTSVNFGNVTMSGHSWRTGGIRNCSTKGGYYSAVSAWTYYPESERVYVIQYIQTSASPTNSSSILSSLENYGNTFHG